ncbi:hypothetical protein [Brochothrix thermosphacta]|uniref:hypothetical protein n=1 Tax=Brochothrix thermosphacta TaxID=2756 RepID=UPI003F9447A0
MEKKNQSIAIEISKSSNVTIDDVKISGFDKAFEINDSDFISVSRAEIINRVDVPEIIETLKEYQEISERKIEELRLILDAKETADAKRVKTNKWLKSFSNIVVSESAKASFDYLKNKFGL